MYEFLLNTHNLTRWILLPLMVVVIVLGIAGMTGSRKYTKADKALGGAMLGLAHLQLLLGLILFFISPQVQAALQDMGAAMKDSVLRKMVVEHPLIGIIAVVLIQLGRSFSKKALADQRKHKLVVIYSGIALVLILSRIPNWNFF